MSQMFETDIASLLPDDHDNVATHTHLMKTIHSLRAVRDRVTQLENDQLRLLDMMEQMVALDKIRAQAFDLLDERVKRAAVHAGLRQQAIDALNERISRAEDLARLRQQGVDILRERVETLEQEVRNG